MREYIVNVLGETYQVTAYDRYYALSQCVRTYLEKHPGSKYNFVTLMSLGSARLKYPAISGRKSALRY